MGRQPQVHLEGSLWRSVHSRLVVAIADALNEQLDDRYRVEIEQRTYFTDDETSLSVGVPDVSVATSSEVAQPQIQSAVATLDGAVTVELPMIEEIKERYLDIQNVETGTVVTTIELLSPKNKQAGEGRQQYERKRNQVLASLTHLIEIDLIRAGKPQPIRGQVDSAYRILVSRSEERPQAQLYAFNLEQPIPVIAVPLMAGDAPVSLDLQQLLNNVYSQPAPPPNLTKQQQDWMQQLLGPA